MFRLVVLVATLVAVASSAAVPEPEVRAPQQLLSGRIVGGSETDISKHPHQISMRYKSCDSCSFNHRCGGSIISPKIILTAAHCVVGVSASRLHIVAGANERNGHGFLSPVEKIVYHEDYYKDTAYENDVAILFLSLEIPVNNFDMKAIELAEEHPANGVLSTVTGWGTTTEGGYASNVLLEVDVNIVSNDLCEADYGDGMINESMLCAGTPQGGKDACQGDSGGPLVANGVLAGIVSWGYGCARPEYPGVYASVANLRSWIEDTISANS